VSEATPPVNRCFKERMVVGMGGADVLYIHPSGNPSDHSIPMGLIGLMNSLSCSKKGKLNYEIKDSDILRSRIIVMDCHWYFPLGEIGRMAKKLKRINPRVKIIVGGQTATIFAESILSSYQIDYVIAGDAEYPFRLLIGDLLEGKDGHSVPNVISRQFKNPQSYVLSKREYSMNDYISIDWFPTFKARMKRVHRFIPFESPINEILGTYPFIAIYKGCKYDCEFCYAGKGTIRKVYGRGLIARSPASVVRELEWCSRSEDIRHVYIIADFVNMLGRDYTKSVFSRKYNLDLYYEFEHFNYPPISVLQRIVDCFNRCYFAFLFAEPFHRDLDARFEYLRSVLTHFRGARDTVRIALYRGQMKKYDRYYRKLISVYDGLELRNCAQWFIPVPQPGVYKRKSKVHEYFANWSAKADRDLRTLCRDQIGRTLRGIASPNRWIG
jgi:hypothetical protein